MINTSNFEIPKRDYVLFYTLYPEKTEYLYFVAKMDGGNNYSTNYEDHLKYVKEYKDERDRLNKEK